MAESEQHESNVSTVQAGAGVILVWGMYSLYTLALF